MSWLSDLIFGPEPAGVDPLKSKAFLVYSEWGPAMKIPRGERLAAKFPSVPAEQREAWMREFAAVESYTQKLAGRAGILDGGEREIEAEVRERVPFLSRAAVAEVISRARYIAYH